MLELPAPLEEKAPGWEWTLEDPVRPKTDCDFGQVNLTGPLSPWLEDENIENKHLALS